MRNARTYLTVIIVLLISAQSLAQEQPAPPPRTVILCAFDEEAAVLNQAMTQPQERIIAGLKITTGQLRGRNVALAQTGIGKVNAAMTTTAAIITLHPSEIVFSGIAGGISPDVHPGDIVIGTATAQHDVGHLESDGFRHTPTDAYLGGDNPLFFKADERLLQCAETAAGKLKLEGIPGKDGERAPKVSTGVIVTGDMFVASSAKKAELVKEFKADAVEMEGAAVAQVCHQMNVPCIVIRSISDNADENANTDLKQFYKIAAANSAKLIIELVDSLAKP